MSARHKVPRWLRPKLTPDQVRDLGLAHWQNVDALHSGQGNVETLWQIGGGIFTWSYVANALKVGMAEMLEQSKLFDRVVAHWRATGRVEWPTPQDYALAADGAAVMDELAKRVDRATAIEAADWSEKQINTLSHVQMVAASNEMEVCHG